MITAAERVSLMVFNESFSSCNLIGGLPDRGAVSLVAHVVSAHSLRYPNRDGLRCLRT